MKLLRLPALLALVLFINFSCEQNNKNTSGNGDSNNANESSETEVPRDGEPAKFKDAKLEGTEILSTDPKRDSVFIMLHGKFSSPCEILADIKQERNGNDIKVFVSTITPPGAPCPPAEVPMHHSIAINTKDLAPGKYNVDINGQKTSFVKK